MPTRHHLRILSCAAVLAGGVLAGCSDDEDSGSDRASTNPGTASVEKPEAAGRGEERARQETEKKGPAKKGKRTTKTVSRGELEKEREAIRREEAEDRKADREFDQAFRETGFQKLVGRLPIRKPPLYVEQYITDGKGRTVYTAVSPKRFFCGRSPARRRAAVTAFYRDADRLFRQNDVDDFVQIVTPLSETTERLPALAVARDGKVTLTKRGRAKGPC